MRIIESMTRVTLPNKMYIRVWRQENELKATYDNNDIHRLCKLNTYMSPEQLAEKVCTLPRINAVEVLDADGSGLLIYPDWP
jgi:hypothetical protein